MTRVQISGELVCTSLEEAETVARHLPLHIRLTRAEPGCIAFNVEGTESSLIWRVDEEFRDPASLRAHQHRVATSQWGAVTAGMKRIYKVVGNDLKR